MLADIATNNFAAAETMEACPKCSALSMGLYLRRRTHQNGEGWWICASCGAANPVQDEHPVKHKGRPNTVEELKKRWDDLIVWESFWEELLAIVRLLSLLT